MKKWTILMIILLVVFLGCDNTKNAKKENLSKQAAKSAQAGVQKSENIPAAKTEAQPSQKVKAFNPFYVYQDKGSTQNHYVPSGFMPNGNCVSFDDKWTENCHSGSSCIKIDYDVQCSRNDQKWTGIYWLNPANNWGKRKGGFNLTGAKKLTFWAKGEVGGEQINEVTIGGITGDYPDSDKIVMGPIILLPVWKQYTIDLRGKDLSSITGGFSWTTSEEVNADKCTFYLDDMKFE